MAPEGRGRRQPPTASGGEGGQPRRPRRAPWLTRNVTVLSAVSLAQDAASELLYPLLPILITSILGAPAAVVGVVEGIAEGFAAALKYVSGRWSDRVGRKPAVTLGYGLAAVGKIIIAAAQIWPVVLAGRVVDRIGKGIRGAPRDALLAEEVTPTDLGKVYGFHRAADTLGAVIGPLLGLAVLSATGDDIRLALWVAVIPAVLSVALVGLTQESHGPRSSVAAQPAGPAVATADCPDAPTATTSRSSIGMAGPSPVSTPDVAQGDASLVPAGAGGPEGADGAQNDVGHQEVISGGHARLPSRVRTVAAVLALFALVNFPDALVLLRISELGYSATAVVGAYALFNAANAAIAFPAGALSDRWPRSRVYAAGLACFAVGYLGLGLVSGGPLVLLLLLVYGGFAGITDGVGKAWISALSPPAMRGHAQGLFQALSGIGVLVAGLWAGLAWQLGPGAGVVPLVISGTVAAVAAVGLALFGRRLDAQAA